MSYHVETDFCPFRSPLDPSQAAKDTDIGAFGRMSTSSGFAATSVRTKTTRHVPASQYPAPKTVRWSVLVSVPAPPATRTWTGVASSIESQFPLASPGYHVDSFSNGYQSPYISW